MKKITVSLFALTALSFTHVHAEETGIAHGKTLHTQSCTSCHTKMTGGDGHTLYIRSNRRVNNVEELESQVRRCESNLELKWFDEDINSVTQFLNSAYYKF